MDFDVLPDIPVLIEMIAVKETNGTERLVDGTALELPLLLQVNEKVENLRLADACGTVVRVEEVKLTNPSQVILFRLLAEIFEMDSADEILVPLLRSDGAI